MEILRAVWYGYRYSIKVVILSSTVTTVLCKVWHVRARDQPAHAHSLVGLITGHFNALVIISVLRCTASHVDLVCEDMMACKATQSGQSLHCPVMYCHCGESVVYLTSLGRPTDIGLQFGNALLSLQQVRVEGEWFISSVSLLSFLFLFLSCPSLSSPLLSLFSLSLGDDIKRPTRVEVSFTPNTINMHCHKWLGLWRHYRLAGPTPSDQDFYCPVIHCLICDSVCGDVISLRGHTVWSGSSPTGLIAC